ncbi:hypothetical protein ANCCAN_28436 [Ancylostoma caninum]|uniref:Uncharacterized protein n=1 Tax=Ancylostoma caninum TaxID=29170 RepID=A0A368F4C2_ANCCA|nr:hypothetical protein ANCCAN_28436 [Ancylostoma caninum]
MPLRTYPGHLGCGIIGLAQIRTYLSLPFNAASRLVGGIANREIPVWLREPILGFFARMYDCRMDEAIQSDFRVCFHCSCYS